MRADRSSTESFLPTLMGAKHFTGDKDDLEFKDGNEHDIDSKNRQTHGDKTSASYDPTTSNINS